MRLRTNAISGGYGGQVVVWSNQSTRAYGAISSREVVDMKMHGVRQELAATATGMGFKFTPQELVELNVHGVSSEYLKTLRDPQTLDAHRIVELKLHGLN